MKYVLDSSIAVKWVLPEVGSTIAVRFRDESNYGHHELISPEVFSIELAHALTRAERQGRITVGEARIKWADVMTTPPQFISCSHLVPRAIEIASDARIGVYDCLYVALAEQESCEFVTADSKLVSNLQSTFPFIIELISLP